jgi:hypothetical protein
MIKMKLCELYAVPYGVVTIFEDSSRCTNWVPNNDASYMQIVEACGHTSAIDYCREHDYVHALLAEKMFDKASPTLWAAAHGHRYTEAADWEEKLAYYFQRFIHDRCESPDPAWGVWRDTALRAMAAF